MIIGFIGFGRVSKRLNEIFKENNIQTVTSAENRSLKTIDNIKNSNIKTLKTNLEVAQVSDILISANSPKQALVVAKTYAKECKGIYLDLNNTSKETTLKIASLNNNFIDVSIIGKIEREKPIFYISGENLERLDFLNEFIEIHKISDNIGDATSLKVLRSIYTKSLAGILIESSKLAESLNLKEEFLNSLKLTEGEDFVKSSKSRIKNTLSNKNRKIEELDEILNSFKKEDLIILQSVLDSFKKL